MRKLDRSRPFGTCFGTDGIAFNQDGLPFDASGNEIVEGKAEPVTASGGSGGSAGGGTIMVTIGGVSVSGGNAGDQGGLPADWRSLPWPDLKKLGAKHKAPANLNKADLISFIEKATST